MAEFGARGREDRLPARTGSGTRFPERRENQTITANITDAGGGRRPRTEYVLLQRKDPSQRGPMLRWAPQPRKAEHGPTWVPGWLLNDRVLLYAWLGAMAVIAVDEWHNNGILPRPAKLWYTSLTYFLLMGLGMVDPMIPIANLLGIGFFMVLIYQYNTGAGQFAKGA